MLFVFVLRCALHATLQPPRPTSPTPSPCSPNCGHPTARAPAAEPPTRCPWRVLHLPTPRRRDSARSGPRHPPATSRSGCPRPLPRATTRSITTTITCTSRPRGRPSPSPPTASRRPSFQPCTARDEMNRGVDTQFKGVGENKKTLDGQGEKTWYSFILFSKNTNSRSSCFVLFIYCRLHFCPNLGRTTIKKKMDGGGRASEYLRNFGVFLVFQPRSSCCADPVLFFSAVLGLSLLCSFVSALAIKPLTDKTELHIMNQNQEDVSI